MCQSPSELDAKLPPHPHPKKHGTMATFALKPPCSSSLLSFSFLFLIVPECTIKCVGKYSQTEQQIGHYNDVKTEEVIIFI